MYPRKHRVKSSCVFDNGSGTHSNVTNKANKCPILPCPPTTTHIPMNFTNIDGDPLSLFKRTPSLLTRFLSYGSH